jgi:hypothetical protein
MHAATRATTVISQSTGAQTMHRRRRTRGARTTKATQKDADADAVKTFQLGTARLPANIDEEIVKDALYQWASTLTTDANLPFALPQRVDRTPEGFDMAFLMSDGAAPGEFAPVGAISASVEDAPDGDARVLMIRGFGNVMDLVDTPVVMNSMPGAIRRAVTMASR